MICRVARMNHGWCHVAKTDTLTAANAKALPEAEPGAMRQHVVVPSIGSGEVARSQGPGVGYGHDLLQQFDVGDGLLNVHWSEYLTEGWAPSNRRGGSSSLKYPFLILR